MSSQPNSPRSFWVLNRMLNGQRLVYEFGASAGNFVRGAGTFRVFSALAAVTVASIMSYDRQFRDQRALPAPPPEKPTVLNKKETALIVKADRPVWQSLNLGFWSSLVKPAMVVQKVMKTTAGAEVENSELLATMKSYGIIPLIVNGYKVIGEPDLYARAAEKAANEAVEAAKQRMYLLPWQVITFQVPITRVRDEYLRLRNATEEATRQAATIHQDGVQLFNAAFRYYTTSKLFEFAGGVGAGALTAFAYNKYLASPAERILGPSFRTAASVLTTPVRPMVPRAAAQQLGTYLARRSPLAVLLLLQGLGTYYHTQREFEIFVNDMARSYPDVAALAVQRIKAHQGESGDA